MRVNNRECRSINWNGKDTVERSSTGVKIQRLFIWRINIFYIGSYLLDVSSVDVSEVPPIKHGFCVIPLVDLSPVSLSGGLSIWLDKPETGSHL